MRRSRNRGNERWQAGGAGELRQLYESYGTAATPDRTVKLAEALDRALARTRDGRNGASPTPRGRHRSG